MPKVGWAVLVLAALAGGVALWSNDLGHRWLIPGVNLAAAAAVAVIALASGLCCRLPAGLAATSWMAAAVEVAQRTFNPLLLATTFGPWLIGTILRERVILISGLKEAGRAIDAENQRLAEEAVRLERARIARELHDIVAHCVSAMVVQAYAGERLTATNPGAAAEAFDQIAITASQASREVAHLVDLLADEPTATHPQSLPAAVRALVASARATGLDVTLDLAGPVEHVPPTAAAAAYRIAQEGITNALKHSRGSPIHISIASSETVVVDIVNGAARSLPDRLASSGGGHGLEGIRDRVVGLGGSVRAGPEPGIGWRLHAEFPASLS